MQEASEDRPSFWALSEKTAVAHTLTYVLMGLLASHFLDYAALYLRPDSGMRPLTSPWVMAGPLVQPLRGVIFATVFYPFRHQLFKSVGGWMLTTWMLTALGILSTFGPASGSIEGVIYTTTPILQQLRGWLEIVPQAVLFSTLLCYWVRHPEIEWLSWVLNVLFALLLCFLVLGLVMRKH